MIRSPDEYLSRVPRRLSRLVAGREREVEAALEKADLAFLERIADEANALSIGGRPVTAEEAEIARAPTLAEIEKEEGRALKEAAGQAREDALQGRLVSQLFFAGAATRFSSVVEGPLYFLDVWEVAERLLSRAGGGAPGPARGLDPASLEAIRNDWGAALAAVPPSRRVRLPLGPRILLAYRSALHRLAEEARVEPAAVIGRARLVIHVPDSPDGKRMQADLFSRRFLGFDPRNFLLVPQPLFGGFRLAGGAVVPIPGSKEYPYGHGYSTMQLAQPGAALRWKGKEWVRLEEDVLSHLARSGEFAIRTQRVNDLTQLLPSSLDPDRLAASRLFLDRGHAVVIELVANPSGQKGGNWVGLRGADHRFLVEGMNAKWDGWPDFMDRHRGAPYNVFRNLYAGLPLRRLLLEHDLPDHLRIRDSGGGRPGLYLESVTGDLTQIPAARAAAFRKDEVERIHDLKELKDFGDGHLLAITRDPAHVSVSD